MDIDGITVFVKVAQAGSFSKAARLLAMPNTTVSAKVARLEKRLGVTLIQRTTRKLHITSAGQAYFAKCLRGLSEIEAAEAEMTAATAEPRGVLRITATGELAHSLLPAIARRFLDAYPQARLDVIVSNRIVDLVGEGVDLAIRAGHLEDSTLVARRLLSFAAGLWASPDYLAQHGAPQVPPDLANHEIVEFSRLFRHHLRLRNGQRNAELAFSARLAADDLETVRAFLLQGEGIGPLPDFLARDDSQAGRLTRVLPGWTWVTGALSLVYPRQPFVPAKVRAFIDLATELVRQ